MIAPVISSAAPMVETTLVASPTGLCGLVPYTGSDSDSPDEMTSPEHISPLPAISPFICTDSSDGPPLQDPYVAKLPKRVGPLPAHRLASRHASPRSPDHHSSSSSSSSDSSPVHSLGLDAPNPALSGSLLEMYHPDCVTLRGEHHDVLRGICRGVRLAYIYLGTTPTTSSLIRRYHQRTMALNLHTFTGSSSRDRVGIDPPHRDARDDTKEYEADASAGRYVWEEVWSSYILGKASAFVHSLVAPDHGKDIRPMGSVEDFMQCQQQVLKEPKELVGLRRWSEKMETVFPISNCPRGGDREISSEVCNLNLYSTCTNLVNSHKKPSELIPAYALSWRELMKLMTEVYCPRNEIQKMETELWNLSVKNNDIASYTQRFQELTMMCTKMVPEEEDRVEKFIGGLPDNIQGNVIAAEPTRLQDAVRIANNLMDQKLKGYAVRNAENKRRLDNNYGNNRGQQPPYKRQNTGGQNVARAYVAGNNEGWTFGQKLQGYKPHYPHPERLNSESEGCASGEALAL
ncbi:reverse transcriptase domain-containing protein [Tanacetum coccineum]|uniref:Reverse transcriptase domain-containing protein n=1 Tax=Tanacetum coccineum TaxID=301880 RepID=A0ABQ5BL88_9ASTR